MLYLKKLVRCFLIKAIEHLEYLKTIDEETFLDKLTENTLFWKLIHLNTQEWGLVNVFLLFLA